MLLSKQKAVEVVQLYFESHSPTTTIRVMQKRYPGDEKLSRYQIHRIVNRFKQTGSVEDGRHANNGRPKTSRSAENVSEVRTIIEETPQKSVRQVLGDITHKSNYSSVYRMLKFDLNLFPYTIPIMQHLKESDVDSRLEFAIWMKDHLDIVDCLWFSDESHFHLNSPVNKRNCRFWGKEKPDFHYEEPLHDDKVTAWAALSSSGVIGPFFFEDRGETQTINSECYLALLKNKFVPALRREGIQIEETWFQQDGAAPHTAGHVLKWLRETFGNQLISLKTEQAWPPHSPDLSPLDFFLWGYLKEKVYTPKPTTVQELKTAICREMQKITPQLCASVITNFKRRLDVVISQNGRHIEQLL